MRKAIFKPIIYIASIFLFIVLIQLCSVGVNNEIILPSILDIGGSFFQLLGEKSTYLYIGCTVKNLCISLGISLSLGIFLGLLAGIIPYMRMFLKPWITILRSVPLASFIIIVMVLAGFSKTPYYVCGAMLVPMIYEGICQGVLSIDSHYMDVWKLHSRLSLKVICKVHIPLIASHSKAVFISSVGMGIKVIIMAEYLAGVKNTLGYAILPAANMFNYDKVYAYSILIILVVLGLEVLPKGILFLYRYFRFYSSQASKKNV